MSANDETQDGASPLRRLSSALADFGPLLLEPGGSRQASVALMLRERKLGLELLVIKRAENELDRWSGQMALPGGGREPGDGSVYDTARRETLEEVGIDLDEGRLLGRLDDMRSRTIRILISVVVVAIDAEPGPLDTREVVEAFWVPVNRLVDEEVRISGFPGTWPAFTYRDHYVIWGLTHRILTQLWKLAPYGAPGLHGPR